MFLISKSFGIALYFRESGSLEINTFQTKMASSHLGKQGAFKAPQVPQSQPKPGYAYSDPNYAFLNSNIHMLALQIRKKYDSPQRIDKPRINWSIHRVCWQWQIKGQKGSHHRWRVGHPKCRQTFDIWDELSCFSSCLYLLQFWHWSLRRDSYGKGRDRKSVV